jgi:predicted SnoaL-like aldol condensation-catalyzing enzyme
MNSKPTPPHQSSELLENNKQLVHNFVNDVLNKHDISAADKYFAQDPKPFKEFLWGFFQRYSDSHTAIEHVLAEGDKVFVMMINTTTDGQTGKRVTIKAADLFRIENSKFVEHWDVVDRSEMT